MKQTGIEDIVGFNEKINWNEQLKDNGSELVKEFTKVITANKSE